LIYDLHCHTSHSDGELPIHALIDLAIEKGVDVLSITDHDTVRAYQDPICRDIESQKPKNIKIVPGIEFSTQWQKIGVHILGLNIQAGSAAIEQGVNYQSLARKERAEKIAERLGRAGLKNALEGAKKIAGQAEIARPHFARYMVECGFSKSLEQAFKKHLGAGRPGDIKQLWAPMDQIIDWIKQAGGIPVMAHPHKYKLTRTKLLDLLDDFKQVGGEGIEVLSGSQGKDITEMLRDISVQKNLLASIGSDFHSLSTPWCKLGMHTSLPQTCKPVWSAFK